MDSENLYWERIKVVFTEHDVDARWLLKNKKDSKTYGSLRIVSHPDLKPGHLRSHCVLVNEIKERTKKQIQKAIDDYKMKEDELEVYSVKDEFVTDTNIIEAPLRELENMFQVKVFEK